MDQISQRRIQQQQTAIEAMKGPQSAGHAVIIEGRRVPNLTMIDDGGPEVFFCLDNRLQFPFPRELAIQAATFAANAMAIGAGFASIGYCEKPAPWAPKCCLIAMPEGDDEPT